MPKILLVEDNEMNRDMLSRRLQRKGYEVMIAVDGQLGVEMARSEVPDLILMDMSLPVIDGWEATRALKAAKETSSIPIIALTAHAMSTDRDKAIAAGCDDLASRHGEERCVIDHGYLRSWPYCSSCSRTEIVGESVTTLTGNVAATASRVPMVSTKW